MFKKLLFTSVAISTIIYADSIIFHGEEYQEVKSSKTGKIWLDRNLGAKRVCQSIDDKKCFGDYYQWGRLADGHEKLTSRASSNKPKNLDNPGRYFIIPSDDYNDWASNLDSYGNKRQSRWNGNNNSICPTGYHVPSLDEFASEVRKSGLHSASDLFHSFLKIPSAGRRDYEGSYRNGTFGTLWLNTLVGASYSKTIYFDDGDGISFGATNRAYGFNVRCIKN